MSNISVELSTETAVAVDWFTIIIPTICGLGVIGNVLNLLVLTRRRLLCTMDRLEKSATYGLVALAFSDMMFCLSVLPHAMFTRESAATDWAHVYELYYRIYGIPCINLFMMISSWLVVSMAVNRYIVVVYPFHARQVLGATRTFTTIALIYVISFVFTLPFFIQIDVRQCLWVDDRIMYELALRFRKPYSTSIRTYIKWAWPVFADFIPVAILAFCNIRLIRALRMATSARKRTCQGQTVRDSSHKVTLTLVIIVLMVLFLVSPSEILRYINPYKSWGHVGHIIASVTNIMQATNFAFNFVLYCLVNATFRQTLKSFFRCCSIKKDESGEMQTMLTETKTCNNHVISIDADRDHLVAPQSHMRANTVNC